MSNTIKSRLETAIANCEFQGGFALWDDLEKLESCLELLKMGKSIHDQFEFVTPKNHENEQETNH